MNGDDRDLSEVFDELSAPSSVARYADRTPAVPVTHVRAGWRWPQALAGVTAVLIALGGAGTFLALRTARQGNLATAGSGTPAGRSGAAMAYDSTSGVTVMFGGTGAGGTVLRDTWLWDGSTWRLAAGSGPGRMATARLSDDPTDGGVLLVGSPAYPVNAGIGGVTGCATGGSSGSASANPGTAVAGPPTTPTGGPGRPTGAPGGTPVPSQPARSAPAATTPPTLITPNVQPCPIVVTPTVQTWIYNAHGWHRVDAGRGATMPFGDAQLAYDPASGDVIAVSSLYYPCGPLPAGVQEQPLIACEGSASASSAAGAPDLCTRSACGGSIACPLVRPDAPIPIACGGSSVQTWVWGGGQWTPRSSPLSGSVISAVVLSGTAGGHAWLVADTWESVACQGAPKGCASLQPATSPLLETWRWTGSSWSPAMSGVGQHLAAGLATSVVTAADGKLFAVAPDGRTSTLDLTTGAQAPVGSLPARTGQAIAPGPNDTVVLFGGIAARAVGVAAVGVGSPGSDTWTWSAGAWHHVAGVAPAPPTPCPSVSSLGSGCVEILPAPVPPAAVPPSTPLSSPKPSPNP